MKNSLIFLIILMPIALFAKEPEPNNTFFGQDAAKDGPITICSNALHYDQLKNELVYEGNVTVMQIKGLELSCSPLADNANKQDASLWVSPKNIDYNAIQEKELNIAKSLCNQQGNCRYMSGQKLIVYLDEKGQAKTIQMLVDNQTDKLPVAKYYSLETDENSQQTPSFAYSKLMEYQPQSNLLTLEKNAYIKQKNNAFEGDKITYNTQTEVVNVPKKAYQRAKMVISQENTKQISGIN